MISINRCMFSENSGNVIESRGDMVISNTIFNANIGENYIVSFDDGNCEINNCTFADDRPGVGNGVIKVSNGVGNVTIDSTIIEHDEGYGVDCNTTNGVVQYSNINSYYGEGGVAAGCGLNIIGTIDSYSSFNQLSMDGNYLNDSLELASWSDCIDAGNPDPGLLDVDGTRNDMGAYGGPDPYDL
jgi:hypothetical protein